jgi:signal transduction histidine kinase
MSEPDAKKTVLVVDDTPSNIQTVNSILKELYRVRIASNGPRALELVKVLPAPDLVLLDVMMPGMDGYEVCTRLKADPRTSDIPVIFLTSQKEIEDEIRGFEVGAVDYIHKPFSPPIMKARIQTHLVLREAHKTVTQARDQARAANQARASFLANMSHELRTPLNAILGFSNLLRESHRIPEEERKDLEVISRNGEHLLTLINNVLDMAKIDAGHIVIKNAPVNLSNLAMGVLDLVRLQAEKKGLELSLQRASGFTPYIETDGEKLRQLLINLVGNAVKYTEHGSIILRVGSQPAPDPRNLRLAIEVRDTGIGIASNDQAHIFDPLAQADKLSTHKGTGLGLAITKSYIELMGGSIQLESASGKGSVFRLHIPVRKLDGSEMPASQIQRGRILGFEPGQPEYRVLIVEDQPESRLLLERLLEHTGCLSLAAENGTSCIEKFVTWRPHFIWMDWRLPDMDGLEAMRRIRELDGGRDVKIAILSAFAFAEYRDQALAAGADDFLSKPFHASEIFDCLARHLGARYRYQEPASQKTATKLCQEELAALPTELRKELEDAIISLDVARIAGVIGGISEHNPILASTISQYTGRYAYSFILQALRSLEARRS